MSFEVRQGDCVELMAAMPACSVDSVVCDPPYGLEFMGKDWDRLDAGLPQENVWKGRRGKGGSNIGTDDSKPSSRHHVSLGAGKKHAFKRCTVCGKRQFSGSPCECPEPEWSIEYPEGAPSSSIRMQRWHQAWATEALRVLKPGGHLLAFGGTRTSHRLACAIEDAGFEIRDTICWLYGSGFPKSLDVGKAIDRAAGAEREVTGNGQNWGASKLEDGKTGYGDYAGEWDTTAPATPEARQWAGWGTALKPAHEPVVVARKPLSGTVAQTVLEWGTGSINVNGCRIGTGSNGERGEGVSGEADPRGCPVHGVRGLWQTDEALAVSGQAGEASDDLRADVYGSGEAGSGQPPLDGRDVGGQAVRLSAHEDGLLERGGPGAAAPADAARGSRASASDGPVAGPTSAVEGTRPSHQRGQAGQSAGELDADGLGGAHARASGGAAEVDAVGSGEQGAPSCTCESASLGRWPANVCLSHMEECVPVGTRKIKTQNPATRKSDKVSGGQIMPKPGMSDCYGDPDGTETVTAWRCHPDCAVRLLDEQTGELTSGSGQRRPYDRTGEGRNAYGYVESGQGAHDYERDGDSGGASRFFLTVPTDTLCVLCNLPCVEPAEARSPPSAAANATAASDAPAPLSPALEDSSPSGDTNAKPAEEGSTTTRGTVPQDVGSTAPPSADTPLADWIAQRVRSAVSLCDSCVTATAHGVAEALRNPTEESPAGWGSTSERNVRTLSQSLALVAAGARSTGTIPTTATLSALCGSAVAATQRSIPIDGEASEPDQTRLRYCPKSSRSERNAGLEGFEEKPSGTMEDDSYDWTREQERGRQPRNTRARNVHPTVKPIDLMRWLVRLVTPPGGLVLDPFAGSGTTGCACALEGFDFLGIEREPEYADVAEGRIAWWHKHRGDGEAAEILAAGELRDEVEATGQMGMFDLTEEMG